MSSVSYDKPMARTFREIIALNTEKLIENKNLQDEIKSYKQELDRSYAEFN